MTPAWQCERVGQNLAVRLHKITEHQMPLPCIIADHQCGNDNQAAEIRSQA
jgi:hypothetical protein